MSMPRSNTTTVRPSQAVPTDLALEELGQYRGRWVAFSGDGCRLIASAASLANLDAKLREAGEDPEEVLLERIPEGDSIVSGSELS
jgi:hypothetical protein